MLRWPGSILHTAQDNVSSCSDQASSLAQGGTEDNQKNSGKVEESRARLERQFLNIVFARSLADRSYYWAGKEVLIGRRNVLVTWKEFCIR